MRENPAGLLIWPPPLGWVLVRWPVVEDPLVCRRAHSQRTDARDELGVVQWAVSVLVAREQPIQRVIGVGDEAVERRRRVVLGEAHDALPSFSEVPDCASAGRPLSCQA